MKRPFDEFSPDAWGGLYVERIRKRSISDLLLSRPLQAKQVMRSSRRKPAATNGGIVPLWSYSGNEIYSIGPKSEMLSVSITYREKTLEPGPGGVVSNSWWRCGGIDTLSDCNTTSPETAHL